MTESPKAPIFRRDMRKLTLPLTPAEWASLRAVAEARRVSMAEAIRQLVAAAHARMQEVPDGR